MTLKWEKLGQRTWYGEDGWLRYHIECKAVATGKRKRPAEIREYFVARGGIMCADWFTATKTLSDAKKLAQADATKREDKLLALPSVDPSTLTF